MMDFIVQKCFVIFEQAVLGEKNVITHHASSVTNILSVCLFIYSDLTYVNIWNLGKKSVLKI